MNTMDCKDIKALLSAIIDDELDADRRHTAERHLADCRDCRAIINEAEGLNDLIALDAAHLTGGADLPEGFEQRVLQRTVYADNGARLRRYQWSTWTGWLAAAASLAIAAAVWFGERTVMDQAGESLVITGSDAGTELAPSSSFPQPIVRPAAYTTGVDLRSQTFDGGLPAEAFSIQRASLGDVTMPYDPVFAFTAEPGAAGGSMPPAPLLREDADTAFSASVLLDMFAEADLTSFADIERIRQAIEADELLLRLSEARSRLSDADRAVIFVAESILFRVAHGPLDHDDTAEMQQTIERMNLQEVLKSMGDR